jgi:hypothetical protein
MNQPSKLIIFPILYWSLGTLTVLSFVLGLVFQELDILRNIDYLFVVGFIVGIVGIGVTLTVHRVTTVARTLIQNRDVIKSEVRNALRESKQAMKSHNEWSKKQGKLANTLGMITLVLFIIIILSGITLAITNGHPIAIAVFAICFTSALATGITASLVGQRHVDKTASKSAHKSRAAVGSGQPTDNIDRCQYCGARSQPDTTNCIACGAITKPTKPKRAPRTTRTARQG